VTAPCPCVTIEFVETSWTVIRGAAAGDDSDREECARRYGPAIRAYLGSRWRWSPLLHEIDDAVQEVFLDCFRPGGALDRADPDRPGGFRAFLYGIVRNVARRMERDEARRRVRPAGSALDADRLVADEESLGRVFDRAWATSLVREARQRQAELAESREDGAARRVDLLRLRFEEGLPIREIARRWSADPAALHHEYAKARREFRDALMDVVAAHHPGPPGEVARECSRLLGLLRS
jgi:RNA polymerase sigma-70 factor (ECF subfamily)